MAHVKEDGNIPPHYVMQRFHYMAVTGKKAWYIAAVILGREFIFHKLTWADGLIKGLTAAEQNFWENHIMTGIMPDPDSSKTCDEVIRQCFGAAKKESAVKLVGFNEKLDALKSKLNGLPDSLTPETAYAFAEALIQNLEKV